MFVSSQFMLFIANFIELFYINNSERIRILNINFLFVQRIDSTQRTREQSKCDTNVIRQWRHF